MARQRLGQHFLSSPAWQARILAELPEEVAEGARDIWVEIGPGHGEMTRHLARRAGRLVAVEADARLAENLRREIEAHPDEWPGVVIAEGDVLTKDLAGLAVPGGESGSSGRKFRVYGNLPYYITSPILHHLFQWADRIASIHIVIQLEVAERIAARPGVRDYGYLSVACQFYARPEIALKIPPGAFRPPPKVTSAMVTMTLPGERAALGVKDEAKFLGFVQKCFAQKRKTLANNLRSFVPEVAIREALKACGLASDVRAEQISVKQFAELEARLRQ